MVEGGATNSAQLRTQETMLPAISLFYHATKSANEASINRYGRLKQTRSPQDWNGGKDLKGVYFN